NRSLAGSESSDEDMTAYLNAADAISEAFGCVIIIVHHCGVDGTRPRGHTSVTGTADVQLAGTPPPCQGRKGTSAATHLRTGRLSGSPVRIQCQCAKHSPTPVSARER